MTDQVNVSPNHVPETVESSRTFRYGATGDTEGIMWPGDSSLLADVRSELTAGPYNEFASSHGGGSLTVTIDTGEAIIGGAPLARDTTTDVTLDASTTGQTVYLGWATSSTDTIKIGLDGDFASSDLRVLIWTYDTDSTGVTNATDERRIGPETDIRNRRYEGEGDGVGVAVDAADDANTLGGVAPTNYLRADINDSMSGIFGVAAKGSPAGSLGDGDGEVLRYTGDASDSTLSIQGGNGRISWSWNAYYDDAAETWRAIVGGEPAALIGLLSFDPGPGVSSANILFGTAPAVTNAGDALTFEFVTVTEDGNLNFNGNEAEGMRLENRSDRPSNPEPGRIIYRTDQDS